MALRIASPTGAVLVVLVAACDGPQSALDVAGDGATRIADLFWGMAAGAAVIWIGVVGLAVYATRVRPGEHSGRTAKLLLIGGGVVFPTIVLTGLLSYGLLLIPELREPSDGRLIVSVTGEQWWWRVRYETADGRTVELANELRLPVGEAVEVRLESRDVIHAFWVPSLAGKIDMVPGRVTRLSLKPTRTGEFRGACAEYCGESHALMAFPVAVMEPAAFAAWLEDQHALAAPPSTPETERGARLFMAMGCGSCHAVRGTAAAGTIGPDLTHIGGRASLGAGILVNDVDAFARWIAETDHVKPGVRMPAFGMLAESDLRALGQYLESLQ